MKFSYLEIMKFQAVLFDLDQTLVDSSRLEDLRNTRQWAKVLQSLNLINFDANLGELLNILSNSGVKIGIITNSPGNYAESVLRKFQIPFHSLVAYHDVAKRKPDPESFFKTLSKFNLTPDKAVSIGDQDNDILASKRANICAVGVKWYTPTYNFSIKPNFVHSKIEDLSKFLIS